MSDKKKNQVRESVGGSIAKTPGPEDVATPPDNLNSKLITHEFAYGTRYRLQTPIVCF